MKSAPSPRRTITFALLLLLAGVITPSKLRAAIFQNLDFEAATVPFIPAGQFGTPVSVAQGLPGWRGFVGVTEQTHVLHNDFTLGHSSISIFGPNSPGVIIEGNYSALLTAGFNPGGGGRVDVTLSQVGAVPVEAMSIRFRAQLFNAVNPPLPFNVTLGGQDIPMFLLSTDAISPVYGGDVSGFAGSTVELAITSRSIPFFGASEMRLDSVQFSPTPIPEPSATWLLVAGVAIASVRRWKWRGNGSA